MALPLFEFLRRGRKTPLSLVVSIDGSRAGAALLDASGAKPVIRFSSEADFISEAAPTADALLAAVLAKLGQVLAAAREYGLRAAADAEAPAAVRDATVFVGAPWCDSSVKRLCVAKETPMTLGQRGLDRIIERNDFALRLAGALDEKVVARAAANGYPVENPVGVRARSFELTLFLAAIEPALKDGVRAAVAAAFPGAKVGFASQARALFDLVRALYPHDGHTLVLDIGGELIETVRLDGDDLAAVGSAPVGVSSAVRGVASRCSLSPAAAAAALRAHAESGGGECADGVPKAVAETAAAWGSAIRRAAVSPDAEAPSRVIVCADAPMLAAARTVVSAALPGAETIAVSARNLEPLVSASPEAHPTTVACALALHSRRAQDR
jgi:hypothetical protein